MENKQEALKKKVNPKEAAAAKKGKTPEIKDKVKVDFEPEIENLSVREEFEDFSYIIEANPDLFDDPIVEEYMTEVLSIAGRIKRKQQVRRYKAKMLIARRRSLRRRASQTGISKRAKRTAVSNVKRKLAGGRAAKDLTYSERSRVEKLAARRKVAIQRQAKRLIIKKRQQERKRLANVGKRR